MIETCDVAIIGAGPAGANAGMMAASQGCHTIIIDEQAMPGGQIWRAKSESIKSAPMTPEIIDGDKLRVSIAESNLTHIANARVWQIERELKRMDKNSSDLGGQNKHIRCTKSYLRSKTATINLNFITCNCRAEIGCQI